MVLSWLAANPRAARKQGFGATQRAVIDPDRVPDVGALLSGTHGPTPLYFLPKDSGVKVAAYVDAGSLWNYVGPTSWAATGETLSGSICAAPPCPLDNAMHIRSSVGVGLIWDSPFGPLRFDYAVPLTSEPYDRTQRFRFGGGTKF